MAQLRSRRIAENLVYYQNHRRRIVDAVGQDVVKYINDFVGGTDDDTEFTEFTITRVEAGAGESTVTKTNASGGALLLTTDANENDGISLQLGGESFKLSSSQQMLYGGFFGVTINDVTQSDFFLGLAITDTAILSGVTDRIGFQSLDGVATVTAMLEKNSTETLTAALATIVDATAFDLEFYFDGTNVEFFIDGASVAAPVNTNLPDDEELRLSLEFLTGEAVAQTMQIDKVAVIQIGR